MDAKCKSKSCRCPCRSNISKIEPGQLVRVIWRGKPVWLINRNEETIGNLKSNEALLADPNSDVEAQQPAYAKNEARSRKPGMMIAVGICTHLGCSPTYMPVIGDDAMGASWKGGFFCPCHGSSFDMAGRVFKNVPAPTNLVVPPHFYKSDDLVLIGEDGGDA